MTWGIFKHDAISEAYTKMKSEELKGNQKKLDKNKNGKLDKQDFAILRNEDYDDETAVDKSKVPAYLRKNDKLTLKDLDKERTKNRSHPETLLKINGTQQKEETEATEELLEYESKDGVYKHQAKAGRYGGTEKESDYVKGPSDAALKKIEAEKKKKVNEAKEGDTVTIHKPGHPLHGLKGYVYHSGKEHATVELHDKPKDYEWQSAKNVQVKHNELKIHESVKKEGLEIFSEKEIDTLINEVLSKNASAGEWISDFVKSDNPKFAGKSKEQRKKQALAAYYAAQRNESTDYDSFLDEAVQKGIVSMDAKEIKHANMKDKQDDQEVMEPHSGTEQKFLDAHSVIVTDEPNKDGTPNGADKVKRAAEPKGKGPGSYDAKEKLGKQGIVKEDSVKIGTTATGEEGETIITNPQDKKTFRDLKGTTKAARSLTNNKAAAGEAQ
jgi:hypothetical protein